MNIQVLPDFTKLAAPFLSVVGNVAKVAAEQNTDSIIQYSAPARIEPVTVLDGALATMEEVPDILRTLNTMFSAYYMQAIARRINIDSMVLLRNIDSLKPDRDLASALGEFVEASANEYYGDNKSMDQRIDESVRTRGGALLSVATESMALPDPTKDYAGTSYMTLEADDGEKILMRRATPTEIAKHSKASTDQMQKLIEKEVAVRMGEVSKTVKGGKLATSVNMDGGLLEAPNLAIGKIFEVTMDMNGRKVSMPVLVSLRTITSTSANMVDLYTVGKTDKGAKERWHGWMSGQLRFLADIVMCDDLIQDHKRVAIRDNTGVYMLNRDRDATNKIAAVLTGKASIGSASNIVLMAKQTCKKVEAILGGKLDNYATREKLFKGSYVMLMVVVDTEWKQVTVYHRGIPEATEMSIGEFTRAKSKPGSDSADIVRMFLAGKAPTL